MTSIFEYIKCFAFKNFFAFCLTGALLYLLKTEPQLRDIIIVILTLVVKYYFDTSNSANKKDDTISKALDQAQQLPAVNSNKDA